jgi:hypothetical protein
MSITQHTAQGKPYHKPNHMQKAGGVVGISEHYHWGEELYTNE